MEHIIREDFLIEAMEIIELYCELLIGRFGLLEQYKHCDPSLLEAVMTMIYAAPRLEVKELMNVRDALVQRFGKDLAQCAMENKSESVNSRIVHKLSVQAPDPFLVEQYLRIIAKSYNIEWEPAHPIPQPSKTKSPCSSSCSDVCLVDDSVSSENHHSDPYYQHLHQQQHMRPIVPPPFNCLPPQYYSTDYGNTTTTSTSGSSSSHHDQVPSPPSHPPPMPPPALHPDSMTKKQEDVISPTSPSLLPSFATDTSPSAPAVPDFDDLAKRFEALKKRT